MDFHALPRRDLQALAKRNGIRANMSNVAMADALAALPAVDGIEEYVRDPVAEPTPAAEPEVQAAEEEEEEKQAPAVEEKENEATAPEKEEEDEREKQEPQEVIMLDDSEEEEKDLTPALGVARRRANRPARVEPEAAPATRKRAAACKAEKGDAAVEAVPARTTRARSQRTVVSATEEEAPKARRASRRAAACKTAMQQEEEEKDTQGDVSDIEADVPAPVSSDEGGDRAEEMEAPMDAQTKEQNEPVEEQSKEDEGETETGDVAVEAVPARATRARSKRTVESVAGDDAPKARRTSRRAAARKTSTEQEEEEKGTQGDVSDVEAAVPAPVSSDEGGDGAEEMETAMDAQNEEKNEPVEEDEGETEKGAEAAEAVPARATRARSKRTVVSAAEAEAPKVRRTSRRAVARKTSTEQEEEEKATQGGVSDVEATVPATVSSDEGGHDAEEMKATMDGQSEEKLAAAEAEKGDAAVEAVPARATRARRQRTVFSAAEEEAPKARRTSRRTVARKTNTEQEEEDERAQSDVSNVEAAVPAPSSDKGSDDAEDMEAAIDAQNELAEEEAPKARRTSRRTVARKTNTEQEEEDERAQSDVSNVEAAVPAPSSDKGDDGAEDMEAAIDAQNELVEEQSPEDKGVVVDIPAPLEEKPSVEEDCIVDSSVEEGSPVVLGLPEQGSDGFQAVSSEGINQACESGEVADDEVLQTPLKSGEATEEVDFTSSVEHASEEKEVPTSEEVLQSAVKAIDEQEDMAPDGVTNYTDLSVEDMAGHTSEENEDCTAEDEPPVPEDVDSSVQSNCQSAVKAIDEQEDMAPDGMTNYTDQSVEDMAGYTSEDNEDCTAEDEPPVPEDVDSSVQEQLVHVQQCEETDLASEDTEMVGEVRQAMLESGEAMEEVDCTSDVGEQNEVCTVDEEPPVAEHFGSSLQEPLVDVQQCEATVEEIHLAGEAAETVPVNEVPRTTTEDVDFIGNADHVSEENEHCTVEEELSVAADVHSPVQEPLVAVQQCEATEEIHIAVEVIEMVPVNEVPQAMLESGEATEEVDYTSNAGEVNVSCTVEEEPPVADCVHPAIQEQLVDVQQCEAMEEVNFTSDVGYASEEIEVPASDEMVQSAVKAIEESEVPSSDEVLQSAATTVEEDEDMAAHEVATVEVDFTSDVGYASEEIEVPASDEMVQSAVRAIQESEVPSSDEVLQNAATLTDDAVEEDEDMAADEVHRNTDEHVDDEAVVATDEMPQRSEAMDEGVVEVVTVHNLSQATVTDDEGGCTADITDLSVEEAAVTAVEIPLSLATMDEGVKEEVVTVEILSQATVTCDEGAVMESSFSCDLADVSLEEKELVAVMEENVEEVITMVAAMEESVEEVVCVEESLEEKEVVAVMEENVEEVITMVASMEESVEEVVCVEESLEEKELVAAMEENIEVMVTVDDPLQATVTDEIPHSSATMDESAVEESVFRCGLAVLSVDEEGVMAADEMQLTSATMYKSVEEADTIDNLSQDTVTDGEWAVKESAFTFTGDCTPVVDTATDLSANVFEDATKSLSMDTVEPMVSEPADVPLFTYSSSGGEKNAYVPMSVQQEKEVKVCNEPDALGSFSTRKLALGSCSTRKLRIKIKEKVAVAQESVADGAALCIFSSIGGEENSAEPVVVEREDCNESEALGSHSLGKLRIELNEKVAVAQENKVMEGEKSSVPLDKLSLRKLRIKLRETLNAQKNLEPKRVPLGRLDENAY